MLQQHQFQYNQGLFFLSQGLWNEVFVGTYVFFIQVWL